MIFRKITAAAVPIVAAVAVGAGTSYAQPVDTAPEIAYESALIGDKIVTTLTNGSFVTSANSVDILDIAGNTVVTLPLSFRQDGLEFPMPHAVRDNGRVLELTAVKDYALARPSVTPVASPRENLRAQDNFLTQFGIATAIGGFIGTVIGAVVGLAGIIGGPTVIASVLAGAGIGGVIGTLVVGGPALVIAGIDLISTLAAPPGTSKWYEPPLR